MKPVADQRTSCFRLALSGDEAKCPIRNRPPASVPFIRETEHNCPGQTSPKCCLNLPGQNFSLARFAFAERINPVFTQHQRLDVGDCLQVGKIILQRLLMVKVNIEADKINVLGAQKFCRRIVSKSAETIRVDRLSDIHQLIDKIIHTRSSTPPDDIGRDLIDHGERKEGWMGAATLHDQRNCSLGLFTRLLESRKQT